MDFQDKLKNEPLKRGHESQKKNKVLVIAESKTVENSKAVMKPKKVGHLKMTLIGDLKADTITNNVKEQVEQTADITSDESTSYTKLKEHVKLHEAFVVGPRESAEVLP